MDNNDVQKEEISHESLIFSDLHIHSRFSRACSKEITIKNLVKWARIKGLSLLGTGDFTHDKWLSELKDELVEDEKGILWYEDSKGRFPFILSHEISLVYSDEGKGRRVHLLYLVPNFTAVEKINSWLDTLGRRDYDGRPIFKISCRDFVEKMESIDDRIEVIPAHIWTSWFGVFGSKGGYDSLKDAFKDKVNRIHAIETGISSDPEMNWRIKELSKRNISILSFSDSHSFWPWRLGREATIFKLKNEEELSYNEILRQIRENDIFGTVETDPAYGMYHYDGHRNCGFSCDFRRSKELNKKCPKCGHELTIGVEYRVNELANQESDYKNKKVYHKILPLHEIISLAAGKGMNTKSVWDIYNKLIEKFENEFSVLLKVNDNELMGVLSDKLLVFLIMKNRAGKINVIPGFDGQYGFPVLDLKKEDKLKSEITLKEIKKERDNNFHLKNDFQKTLF